MSRMHVKNNRGSGGTHRLVREHGLGDPAPVSETTMTRRLLSRGESIFRRAVQQELIPEEEFVCGVHTRDFHFEGSGKR